LNQSLTPTYTNNINAGTASATATYAGDANHSGNTSSVNFTIGKAASIVSVDCTLGAPYTYTGSALTPCTAVATGAGSLNQSLTPTHTKNINAGTASATATYAGDANHSGNTNSANFTIGKAGSTVSVDCTVGAPFAYTGAALTPCTAVATGAGSFNQSLTP